MSLRKGIGFCQQSESGSNDPLFFINCTVNNSRVNNNDGIII